MSSFRFRKISFLTLVLSLVSLFHIQSVAATGDPLLLLDYEELDEQHFVVSTYLCDINSLSVLSVPIAFNPESVQVCGFDSETGSFIDITDGTIPSPAEARNGKRGLAFDDALFAHDKWAGVLICNNYYPYISNEEGLIKFTMYTLNDKYSFTGQNDFFKIYFKRISDEPEQIRIATKNNAQHYDAASPNGTIFVNMSEVIDIKYQFDGDVFSDDVVVTPPADEDTQGGSADKDESKDNTDKTDKTDSTGSDKEPSGSDKDDSDKPEDTQKPEDKTDETETPEKIMFSDVAKDFWAYEPIYSLAEKKIINGYEDGTFKPNGSITRAELATIVTIAKQCELIDNKKVFSDSETDAWYNKYLVTAFDAEFISGYPDGTFKPNNLISRQDLCVVLAKAFLKDVSSDDKELSFADADEIDSYALESVKKIASAEIVKGRDGNLFAPKANATRAEVARMVYLCLELAK